MVRWTRLLLVAISMAVGVLLVEAACQVYVRLFPMDRPLGRGEFRATRPPPYRHADYFSQDFLREQAGGIRHAPAVSGPHWLPEDLAGRYFTVANGLRRTTNQPAHPARRLLIFGGSTMLAEEVPDQYTIPSFLQRAINARCATAVVVLNYGAGSMTALQQRSRLMEVGVSAKDIVAFYDGINDVYYGVAAGGVLEHDLQGSRLNRLLRLVMDRASHSSALASLVLDAWDRAVPDTVTDAAILRRSLARTET